MQDKGYDRAIAHIWVVGNKGDGGIPRSRWLWLIQGTGPPYFIRILRAMARSSSSRSCGRDGRDEVRAGTAGTPPEPHPSLHPYLTFMLLLYHLLLGGLLIRLDYGEEGTQWLRGTFKSPPSCP